MKTLDIFFGFGTVTIPRNGKPQRLFAFGELYTCNLSTCLLAMWQTNIAKDGPTMANLKNLDRIFDLAHGETVTVGNNRTIERHHEAFYCRLHGHTIAQIIPQGASGIARVVLNDCGYATPTTRDAMADFARAFGCSLSVSFAKGGMSIRFKNAAGMYADRDCDLGGPNGPYAMGRWA